MLLLELVTAHGEVVTPLQSEVCILYCFLLNNVKRIEPVVVVDDVRQYFPWLCAD